MNFGHRKCLQIYKLDQSFYYIMLSFLVNVQCLHWGWIFATNITGKFHSMLKINNQRIKFTFNKCRAHQIKSRILNSESRNFFRNIFLAMFFYQVEVFNRYQNKEKNCRFGIEDSGFDLMRMLRDLKITTTLKMACPE